MRLSTSRTFLVKQKSARGRSFGLFHNLAKVYWELLEAVMGTSIIQPWVHTWGSNRRQQTKNHRHWKVKTPSQQTREMRSIFFDGDGHCCCRPKEIGISISRPVNRWRIQHEAWELPLISSDNNPNLLAGRLHITGKLTPCHGATLQLLLESGIRQNRWNNEDYAKIYMAQILNGTSPSQQIRPVCRSRKIWWFPIELNEVPLKWTSHHFFARLYAATGRACSLNSPLSEVKFKKRKTYSIDTTLHGCWSNASYMKEIKPRNEHWRG